MKLTIAAIIIAASLIGLSVVARPETPSNGVPANVVTIDNDTQYIDITAKGGYFPRTIAAQSNIPTVIRMDTNATYDCSAALTIPSIGYRSFLPPSGTTEIELPPQEAGSTLQGLCSMGMYSFTIQFEEATTTN